MPNSPLFSAYVLKISKAYLDSLIVVRKAAADFSGLSDYFGLSFLLMLEKLLLSFINFSLLILIINTNIKLNILI